LQRGSADQVLLSAVSDVTVTVTKTNLYNTQAQNQTLPASDSDAVLYISAGLIVNICVVKLVLAC